MKNTDKTEYHRTSGNKRTKFTDTAQEMSLSKTRFSWASADYKQQSTNKLGRFVSGLLK